MRDYLVRGDFAELDPAAHALSQLETERQRRKIILVPSESVAPVAVREALASAFQNIYAEGYPDEETRRMVEDEILDYPARLAHYRRYSDPRYYKGVEYADAVEALARRRCAELFAAGGISADDLYVNVQALSGAPANNAVYHALVEPGAVVMGLSLLHGGHLTHGSPVNRSGKYYRIVSYGVDPESERIDYDAVEALAREHQPKMIIAGYSSYPWMPDWRRFRQIADAVGAYLMADIAHIAGMVAAGVVASPVGLADVITFTTHKSLCGPRGAVILTTSSRLSRLIDRAVFPGEQGGPHVNTILAQAVSFRLARSDAFRALQKQIIANAAVLTDGLRAGGFRIPYGGTDTHMTNIDVRSVVGPDGTPLSGDQAARILDLAGIVANRNTIPGDRSAAQPSGVRLGTPWITQRGFQEADCARLAGLIANVLQASTPYLQAGRKGPQPRARVDFGVLNSVRLKVRDLAAGAGFDGTATAHGYPHFYYLDDPVPDAKFTILALQGEAAGMLKWATSADVEALADGQAAQAALSTPSGVVSVTLQRKGEAWRVFVPSAQAPLVVTWLRDLSDGFVGADPQDLWRKVPGPVVVAVEGGGDAPPAAEPHDGKRKPWFIGAPASSGDPLPPFVWREPADRPLKRTALNETHRSLGARMVAFAGWDMPVWYSSVLEEHVATRRAAGLFDVSHMGVYQAEGPQAASFLDSVATNDVASLAAGESHYTQLLDPSGAVIDDAMIYRVAAERFMMVVNASNDDKDWAWLSAVRDGRVGVDEVRPSSVAFGRGCRLRNLRDPGEGGDQRVDLALQGPKSTEIMLALGCDASTAVRLKRLPWAGVMEGVFGGFDLVVSRTGYTGERVAFELFVHPRRSPALWKTLLEAGSPLGVKPVGLGARDSLRTEAGLPLYGHEMAGDLGLGVGHAGFGSYVKTHKPWFIGRAGFLAQEASRQGEVVRFRFDEKGVRLAHPGDPVVDRRGRVIGVVTSCAVNLEGYLLGQAYLEKTHTAEGTPIAVFQGAAKEAGKAPADFRIGDRAIVPAPATVLSRFPR